MKIFNTVMFAVVFIVGGCASEEKKVAEVVVPESIAANPSEGLTAFEKKMQEAKVSNVGLLSPGWFRGAEKSLASARNIKMNGGDAKDLAKEVAQGEAQLEHAEATAKANRTALNEVLKSRDEALQRREQAERAGVINFKEIQIRLRDADDKFMDLARFGEDNKPDKLEKGKQDVVVAYQRVQTKALQKEKLDEAKMLIEEAKQAGAKKYAPKALQTAERQVESTQNFIGRNPDAQSDINEKSESALFYARRVLALTKESKELSDKEPEEVATFFEVQLGEISQNLDNKDRRDRSLKDQVAELSSEVKTLKGEAASNPALKEEASKAASRAHKLGKEAEELRSREETLAQVSKIFDAEEGEVIRKGDDVIIRLKGIKFPTGEARLGTENYPLLGKVKEALSNFPDASIVVEGHTDSTGSEQVNAKLSQERADAVESYLASSENIEKDKLTAVGKGQSEPIASNKTKEGRAANRRVDIVVKSVTGLAR